MRCPSCRSREVDVALRDVPNFENGTEAGTDFLACGDCGHLFVERDAAEADVDYPADYRAHATGGLVAELKRRQAQALARSLSLSLRPEDSILDIGCGAGHLLFALHDVGFERLSGIDQSPHLASIFAGSPISYREGVLGDAILDGEEVDVILMSFVLEHLPDPARSLAYCRRALAPGGRLWLRTPNAASLARHVFGRCWSGLHAPRHFHVFNEVSLRLILLEAGFGKVDVVRAGDLGGWALSLQNLGQRRRRAPQRGVSLLTLASLPLLVPFNIGERVLGRGQALAAWARPS